MPITPTEHVSPLLERPSSPLPSQSRFQGMVQHVLGSDKVVIQENSLSLNSSTTLAEKINRAFAQVQRGASTAHNTGRVHTEHTYESYSSNAETRSRLDDLIRLSQANPIAQITEISDRGFTVRVPLNLLGYPVDVTSKTVIAPNHNDARPRTLVSEATYNPQADQAFTSNRKRGFISRLNNFIKTRINPS